MNGSNNSKPSKMFQESLGTRRGKSVKLHPHLYSDLYNRASEIKALDKILTDLERAAQAAKQQDYRAMPKIIEAIRDALSGKPQLSWWHLFTLSIGQALTNQDNIESNKEERRYLSRISELLTEIIRNFRSGNSKLLLEIRLGALDVDSRLVEMEKIPTDEETPIEMLDYLQSEFDLFNQELERLKQTPVDNWKTDTKNLIRYIKKANQLIHILANAKETEPKTFQKFAQQPQLNQFAQGLVFLLQNSNVAPNHESLDLWKMQNLNELFDLFDRLPDTLYAVNPTELCTLVLHTEKLFAAETSPHKKRPSIFTLKEMQNYLMYYNEEFSQANSHLKAVVKGLKEDRAIKQNPTAYFKQRFVLENDLYQICGKLRFKASDFEGRNDIKAPQVIQQEIVRRMVLSANISQPKDLDAILKSFSDEEKENRYYLTQEVLLEQFIRWRKQGIY